MITRIGWVIDGDCAYIEYRRFRVKLYKDNKFAAWFITAPPIVPAKMLHSMDLEGAKMEGLKLLVAEVQRYVVALHIMQNAD